MLGITFIGTGEAFGTRINSSYLINQGRHNLLVDCGYSVPQALRKCLVMPDRVPDAVLVTHLHGDHLGGLPQLLGMLWGNPDFRRKKLVLGSACDGLERYVRRHLRDDYRDLDSMISTGPTSHEYRKLTPEGCQFMGFGLKGARTAHGVPNYAYRLSTPEYKLAISGDGDLTRESKSLFSGVDLLIHDGFTYDRPMFGHASVRDVLAFATVARIPSVAIVHMAEAERQRQDRMFLLTREAADSGIELHFPRDGEYWILKR